MIADAWKGKSQGVAVITVMEGTHQGISRCLHFDVFIGAVSTNKIKFLHNLPMAQQLEDKYVTQRPGSLQSLFVLLVHSEITPLYFKFFLHKNNSLPSQITG